MKKLQNDYTTPEQSKRLLELGVPADSVDCFYSNILGNWYLDIIPQHKNYTCISNGMDDLYLPCWSVGRLIEIYLLCVEEGENITPNVIFFKGDNKSLIENLIEWFETESIDFSKLED